MLQYFNYCELVAALAGLAFYKPSQMFVLKLLAIFCIFTFAIEMGGMMIWKQYHISNHWLYNIYFLIRSLFILFFFYSVVEQPKAKVFIKILFVCIAINILISYSICPHFFILNKIATNVYLLLNILVCGAFFIDVLNNNNPNPLYSQPAFYVAIGILFFSVIIIIRYAIWDFIVTLPNYQYLLNISNIIANSFLYGFFIAAFLCNPISAKYRLR